MKILVIGSGGREHAICWALRETSSSESEVLCAPGNGGISNDAIIVNVPANAIPELIDVATNEKVDLTFVGPEAPLVAGIVDRFKEAGLPIVGPSALASQLEGSKAFAKDFMARHGIPTAHYRVASSPEDAIRIVRSGEFGSAETPLVIKADGLAAGKGVVVAESSSVAEKAIDDLMIKNSAGAGAARRLVVEEMLRGPELSILAFTDGRDYALMPPTRDHKRIGEGDTGPNTGGMGTIADDTLLSSTELVTVKDIVERTLDGAIKDGITFKGILFLGLMLTKDGPKLLEYNVRFGDPETQAILVRLETDLAVIFDAIRTQTLGSLTLKWKIGSSACVVAANGGYPGKYESGSIIQGLDRVKDDKVHVFHAGTVRSSEGSFLATGGRVLGITSYGASTLECLEHCYAALAKISWPGMQFRRDIGKAAVG